VHEANRDNFTVPMHDVYRDGLTFSVHKMNSGIAFGSHAIYYNSYFTTILWYCTLL